MRTCVVATAILLTALCSPRARAQSRVSIELGGVVSAYDVQRGSGVGATSAGLHIGPQSTVPGGTTGTGGNAASSATVSGGSSSSFSSAIGAFEIRPTVTLEN